MALRNLVGALVIIVLFTSCACRSPESGASKLHLANASKPGAGTGANTCVDEAQKLLGPLVAVDADDDGKIDRIEVFEASGYEYYPLLVRWKSTPGGRPRDAIWAVATHVIVTLLPGAEAEAVKASFAARLGRSDLELISLSVERTFLLGISPKSPGFAGFGRQGELMAALPDLRASNAGRAVIEPDYLFFPDKDPDDPNFKDKYQDEFLPIHALEAWDVETGSEEVRIAVLDSGIDFTHPSLKKNSYLIVKGSASSGDPFSDLVHGDDVPEDELDHGTYCSAIAGAKGDKEGMVGVNWDVTLMPVKFIDDQGCGTNARAIEAVDYAIRYKAHVISASWGGLAESKDLRAAIERAGKEGILFVASAGNSGLDLDKENYFPASYNLPNMLVVGAADDNGSPLRTSGYGTKGVHLSAPGYKVFSAVREVTVEGPRYPYVDDRGDTSSAAAFVSGAVALVTAGNLKLPLAKQLKPEEIRCRILTSTTFSKDLAGSSCSGGRLDLANAVTGKNPRKVCGCP